MAFLVLFKVRSSDLSFIFLTVLASLRGAAWAIHSIILGDFFYWSGWSHPFVQALYGTDNFWQQLLIKTSYFLGRLLGQYIYLIHLFNQSNCSHPSICFCHRKDHSHPFFEVYCGVFIYCTTCCHSLSLIVICCHSISFVVTCCHSLSPVVPFIVIRCTTRCHSLSLVVIHCHSWYHSISLVVNRCHSMYHLSVFLYTIKNYSKIRKVKENFMHKDLK